MCVKDAFRTAHAAHSPVPVPFNAASPDCTWQDGAFVGWGGLLAEHGGEILAFSLCLVAHVGQTLRGDVVAATLRVQDADFFYSASFEFVESRLRGLRRTGIFAHEGIEDRWRGLFHVLDYLLCAYCGAVVRGYFF